MKVKQYPDYLAYIPEPEDRVIRSGKEILKENDHAFLLPMVEIRKNGQELFLYCTEGKTAIADVKNALSMAYLEKVITGIARTLKTVLAQPYWEREFLDLVPRHVFIDMESGDPAFILVPVEEKDVQSKIDAWSIQLAYLLEELLKSQPQTESPELEMLRGKVIRFRTRLNNADGNRQVETMKLIAYMEENWIGEKCFFQAAAKGTKVIAEVGERPAYCAGDAEHPANHVELQYNGEYGTIGFDIGKEEFIIGKSPECDGRITANRAISRRHLDIRVRFDGCYAEDLESSNHSWLNGCILVPGQPVRLQEDDVLRLANMDFHVHIGTKF